MRRNCGRLRRFRFYNMRFVFSLNYLKNLGAKVQFFLYSTKKIKKSVHLTTPQNFFYDNINNFFYTFAAFFFNEL